MITEKSLKILLENNGIADAKQKLYNKDIIEQLRQGPGVSADKNAYNIFHKQLGNIQNAIIAARKANKENN